MIGTFIFISLINLIGGICIGYCIAVYKYNKKINYTNKNENKINGSMDDLEAWERPPDWWK